MKKHLIYLHANNLLKKILEINLILIKDSTTLLTKEKSMIFYISKRIIELLSLKECKNKLF